MNKKSGAKRHHHHLKLLATHQTASIPKATPNNCTDMLTPAIPDKQAT
jgi:hypothetical protein